MTPAPAEDAPEATFEPLDDNLITLSNLPKSRWVNLGKLDVIRQRNRATETVTVPNTAPFFLSTVPGKPDSQALARFSRHGCYLGLEMNFKLDEDPLKGMDKQSRVLNFGKVGTASAFLQKLKLGFDEQNCKATSSCDPSRDLMKCG